MHFIKIEQFIVKMYFYIMSLSNSKLHILLEEKMLILYAFVFHRQCLPNNTGFEIVGKKKIYIKWVIMNT